MTTTALVLKAKPEDLARVETIIAEFSAAGGNADSDHFGRAFRMAAAIRALHNAITDEMMKEIMHLQGTGLGFLTDKDKDGGYDAKIVKLVAIEASLMGAYWVGNEFNIISERPYLTKNFYTRKLREFPGLTDLKLSPGVPNLIGDKGALVPYVATWKYDSRDFRIERLLKRIDDKTELDERIPVRVNSGMGADAILGKAERKIKAQIYNLLTGSNHSDGDADDFLGSPTKPVNGLEDLTKRLESKGETNGTGNGRAETTEAKGETNGQSADTSDLLTELDAALAACQYLSRVGKHEEEFRARTKDEAMKTEISARCDAARVRMKQAAAANKGEKQGTLSGAT
jgi:hypothetical protein